MTDNINLQKLDNDPRLPALGSVDFDRMMYVRLYELFRSLSLTVNNNFDEIKRHIEKLEQKI